MTTKEFDDILDVVSEGFASQLLMGLDPRNRQDIVVTLKKHSNEKYLNLIKRTKKKEDLLYLRKDLNMGISQYKKILSNIKKCEELGDCEETERFYDGIKKLYMNKGITSKDVEATIKWCETVARQEISKRLKESEG